MVELNAYVAEDITAGDGVTLVEALGGKAPLFGAVYINKI